MEYRILGSIEVQDRGRAIPLNGRRQRAVLGMLLVHRNETVAPDLLVQAAWGACADSARGPALAMQLSRLRKVLHASGERILLTGPGGYVLRTAAEAVDADRFEQLLARGEQSLAQGDPAAAKQLLARASSLWRGSPFAECAFESFAQGEIARLEERRVAALELRIEAELALGRHAEVVAELLALVHVHPLRERLHGQLMLALYRSGRQGEALAAYQAAREALVESLGIEPSPALKRLERAILCQDPALEVRRAAVELTRRGGCSPSARSSRSRSRSATAPACVWARARRHAGSR